MQEITGAKPVRDAILSARGSRGIADPPDSESGSLGRALLLAKRASPFRAPDSQDLGSPLVSRRPVSSPSKHFQRCAPLVLDAARCNSGWGLQFRSRASAQAGFIRPLCRGQHWGLRPFPPPCSRLRISFVKKSCRGSTGWRLHFSCSRSPTAETRRRERRQCRCESCREHQFQGAEATADRHPTFNRVW
jgi:hypothetical protein